MIISKVHLAFAYGLMSFGTASVVMLVIKVKNKAQRVFGIVATAYAAFFLTAYVILKWDYFGYTIFFWENTFIYLFLGELMVEYEESRFVEIFGKAFPFIAVAGGVIPWFLYFAAPRNGESIESLARPYWNVVGAGSMLVFICYIAFNLSFITYMLYRPLAKKHKWADIALRIVITPVVMAAVLFGGYLSIFIFAGAGY